MPWNHKNDTQPKQVQPEPPSSLEPGEEGSSDVEFRIAPTEERRAR